MKLALLIHAHKCPEQLSRLISKLIHPDVDIYVNIDAKVDISNFKSLIKNACFIENRVEVVWGRFSQVEQILNSFQEIISKTKNYSHILFISGQDYPVCAIDDILKVHKQNEFKSFINYFKLGSDDWSILMKKRYEYWHFLSKYDPRGNHYIKKIIQKFGYRRKFPFRESYYGACWFSLSIEAVQYLLNFTRSNPYVVKFFEYSGCADEIYIQSVLLNSGIKDKMINNIYRYFDWNDKGKSPKILTITDLGKIRASKAWFARKFDINVDSKILDKLDELNSFQTNE